MSALDPEHEAPTLVGLLDGLVGQGVHVAGDLVIGLADVDLLRASLRLLVASEDTAQRTGVQPRPAPRPVAPAPDPSDGSTLVGPGAPRPERTPAGPPATARPRPGSEVGRASSIEEADREQLVRGVAQLVLTVVELLRELLERQAIRRVEAGSLSDDQVERLGIALAALEDRMAEVKDVFGVSDEDLNLDLGPLGRLR